MVRQFFPPSDPIAPIGHTPLKGSIAMESEPFGFRQSVAYLIGLKPLRRTALFALGSVAQAGIA